MNSPRATEWRKAMEEEMESLKENDTFELTTLPVGKSPVGGKWVYTIKENAEGSETLKARYVAKGYSQVEGIDYQETFAPTGNIASESPSATGSTIQSHGPPNGLLIYMHL